MHPCVRCVSNLRVRCEASRPSNLEEKGPDWSLVLCPKQAMVANLLPVASDSSPAMSQPASREHRPGIGRTKMQPVGATRQRAASRSRRVSDAVVLHPGSNEVAIDISCKQPWCHLFIGASGATKEQTESWSPHQAGCQSCPRCQPRSHPVASPAWVLGRFRWHCG